jgi:hypothetical protein
MLLMVVYTWNVFSCTGWVSLKFFPPLSTRSVLCVQDGIWVVAQLRITKQNFSTFALSESEMELKVGKERGAWEAWRCE